MLWRMCNVVNSVELLELHEALVGCDIEMTVQ